MMFLSVRNFEKYQHYKDRRPPWIKLYNDVLDDYDFCRLPDASKAHLMMLWLLASRTENKIPNDLRWITQAINATDPVDLEELILRGFLVPYDERKSRGKREDWSSRYVSAQTRAHVLSLAQHKCAECGAREHLEIDHIIPISRGGTGDLDNLQVLCRSCNRKKRVRLAQPEATHVRSELLRRPASRRSLETETETEGETEAEKPRRKRRVGARAETDKNWVAPLRSVWEPRCGPGSFDYGLAGKALKPLHDAGHDTETIGRHLARYLDETPPQFRDLHKFRRSFAEWAPKPVPTLPEGADVFAILEEHTRPRSAA